jgi:chromosome segregation ATPase
MKRALEPDHGPREEKDQNSNENAPRQCVEEDGASEDEASKTKRRNTHEGQVDDNAQEHVNSIEVAKQGTRDARFELCKEQEKLDSAEKQIMILRDQYDSARDESMKCKEVNIELQRDNTELQRLLNRSREHHNVLREIIIPEHERSKAELRDYLTTANESVWRLEVDVEDDHAEVVKCKMINNAHQRRNRELQGRIRVLVRNTDHAKDIISGLEIDLAKTEKKLATTKKELDKLRQENNVHMGASTSETMKLSAIIKILEGTATVVELEVDE